MRIFIPKEDAEGIALWRQHQQIKEDIARKYREAAALKIERRELEKKLAAHVLVET